MLDREPGQGKIDQIRIETLESAHAGGLTSAKLTADAAPWVREGLRVLERGGELTPMILRAADEAQNTQFP